MLRRYIAEFSWPASITNEIPLMKLADGLQRKTTESATSSGSAMRFNGVVLPTTCWIPGTGWSMGVSVQVGLTTFTRISFSMLSVAVLARYLR
jgi:hypothetical protein